MSCQSNCGDSPCQSSETNTVDCESLSSQIANFTQQFFGDVVKTEVNGEIVWSLPCSLDIGLENNPRAEGEGLACYFLRLFNEGIIGATGPQGAAGADGDDGANAFTVVLASFTQPNLGAPNIVISTLYNPAILEGLYVFIQNSGWYLVTAKDGSGTLWLTLVKAVSSPPVTVTTGKLVVPSGFPGQSIVGPQGIQGPQGDQGDPGESHTETNGQYHATVGTDYELTVTFAAVDFVNSSARLLLPTAGTYQITVSTQMIGLTGIVDSDIVYLQLRDTVPATLDGSQFETSEISEDENRVVSFTVIYTSSVDNEEVRLQAKCTTGARVNIIATRTTMTYVKLA
jgi:hypothetical protein